MDRKRAESTELALAEGARLPDAYEQSFMGSEGTVFYRDRHRAPWRVHAAFVALAGAVAGSAIVTGQSIALMLGLPAVALVWLLFSVLRVTVSTHHVHVQCGLFGRKLPVASIEAAEVVTYDWLRGWTVRRARPRKGGWIHRLWPGHGQEAVRIAWRDRTRGRCVMFIGSRRAEVLVAQIERARQTLTCREPRALGCARERSTTPNR